MRRRGSIVRYVNGRDDSGSGASARRARQEAVAVVDHEADRPRGSEAGGARDGEAGAALGYRGGADSDRAAGGRRTDFVQSLDRGLAVIRCFSSEHPSLTLSEVAERTGLTRAAARRFLLTLQELGYVGSSGRQFS